MNWALCTPSARNIMAISVVGRREELVGAEWGQKTPSRWESPSLHLCWSIRLCPPVSLPPHLLLVFLSRQSWALHDVTDTKEAPLRVFICSCCPTRDRKKSTVPISGGPAPAPLSPHPKGLPLVPELALPCPRAQVLFAPAPFSSPSGSGAHLSDPLCPLGCNVR